MSEEIKQTGFPHAFAQKVANISAASKNIEIEKALERLTEDDYLPRNGDIELDDNGEPTGYVVVAGLYEDDVTPVVDAYRAEKLANQRRQQVRDLPIDEEWLQAIGFASRGTATEPYFGLCNDYHAVEIKSVTVRLIRQSSGIGMTIGRVATTTRGMMIDLLDGLLIPHVMVG